MEGLSGFIQFLPFAVLSCGLGLVGFVLAREKGRNVALWTLMGLLPAINFVSVWFFIGAANLRMERKIDELLLRLRL
jgi:hypothetical protein